MVLILCVLQQYLFTKLGILPEQVQWNTRLQQDLKLRDSDVQNLLEEVTRLMNVPDSIGATHHLTDVFDLIVYTVFRSVEELACSPDIDAASLSSYSKPRFPFALDFPQFSGLARRLDACLPVFCNPETNTDS